MISDYHGDYHRDYSSDYANDYGSDYHPGDYSDYSDYGPGPPCVGWGFSLPWSGLPRIGSRLPAA